jgi:outer membrane protein
MTKSAKTLFVTACFLLLASIPLSGQARQITIAVVQDGPSEENEILGLIEPELKHLVGDTRKVVFKTAPAFDAGWEAGRFRKVIENAMKDRQVDLVLGIGALVTQEAVRPDFKLTKPFISASVLNGDVPKIPYSEDGHTLKKNLSVVIIPQRAVNDMEMFQKMVGFKRLHVGVDEVEVLNLSDLKPAIEAYSKQLGVEIVSFPVTPDPQKTLARLPEDVEAFYLIPLARATRQARKTLIEGLNARKIPTFSNSGPDDVEMGALATLKPDFRTQTVRRVALNLFHLIRGASAKELPVFLLVDAKLLINAETAVEIGYRPGYETRIYATFINEEAFETGAEPLDLRQVVSIAEEGNTSLTISDAQLETARRDRQVSRSPLLPQVLARGSYNHSDLDSAVNFLPENQGVAGVSLSQMVFDDGRISDYRSSGRTYDAAQYRRETDLYNVFSEAEQAYLLYVQARLLYLVQLSNLRLTLGNLDIARMRVDAGISGKDEEYRWLAQAAGQRALVLDRESAVEASRIALNQVLGVDQGASWKPQAIEIDPDQFYFLQGKLGFAMGSPALYDEFRNAALSIADQNAPEIKFLSETIDAQQIQVGQRKRSFYLPQVNANLSYDRNFWQSPDVPDVGDRAFFVDVTATLPIFEGTRRVYEVKREQSVLSELNRRRALARELVERQTRTSLRLMESSFPNIRITRTAEENARKNLEIVREKYSQGIANITDLLEAQNASFSAEQAATSAVYRYMIDLVAFQRAISFFEDAKTPDEIDAFAKEIRDRMGTP